MKLLTVIHRELLTRVRTKGFLIFTFGIPLLAAGVFFMEYKIIAASQNVSSTIAVVDLSQKVLPALQTEVAKTSADRSTFILQPVAASPATMPAVETDLRKKVLAKSIDGYLVIPAEVLTTRKATYHTRNAAAISIAQSLQSDLRAAVNRAVMTADGVPDAQIAGMLGDFDLSQLKVTTQGESADFGQAAILAMALTFILYMFLLLYGVVVMKAVTEEKTTRISEVLLSAVDAFTLMLGKILGVVATALTQIIVWGICLALFAVYGVAMAQAAGLDWAQYMPHNGAVLFVCFVLFFLLGFLLYASLYAAIGAVVSSDQEAQQTQMPLTLILVVSIYLAFLVMVNPSSTLSVVLSLIPFFAPVLMLVRVAASTPPLWQVVLSMVLIAVTFWGCTRFTAKLYRIGILMTGKRPTLPELMKWLKYT